MSAAVRITHEPRLRVVETPSPAGWVNKPTLRLDRAAESEAAREIAEFHRTGPRADLNTNWKRPLIHMGVLTTSGYPERT